MKYLVLIMIGFFVVGCGVESASSDGEKSSEHNDGSGDDGTTDGGSTDGDGTTDGGTDDGTTDDNGTSDDIVVNDPSDAGFNKTDAEEDPNACTVQTPYKAIDDSSFDPNAKADAQYGLSIMSQYSYSVDLEATKVVLYFPSLTVEQVDSDLFIYEDNYQIGFDKAWQTNEDPIVYVRLPKDVYNQYSCYRYDLKNLKKTKVYR